MLTRIVAALIAVLALAAPRAALADDAVAGAIVGAVDVTAHGHEFVLGGGRGRRGSIRAAGRLVEV